MRTILLGGSLVTPDDILEEHGLIIEEGTILALLPEAEIDARPGDHVIDAGGLWVAPGLIDLHIHGCNGADTMDADPQALVVMSRFLASHGVTSFLPSTISAGREATEAAITAFHRYRADGQGALPLGLHLEGPYLNPRFNGAQPAPVLRPPDAAEYTYWLEDGAVKRITLAPELDGALALIRTGREKGVYFAAGHTDASYEVMLASVEAGLTQTAHTFNAMSPLHHREPGTVGAALSDERIFAEIIVDGVHIHPAVVRLAVKAKGTARVLLVSDAMRATGLPDGEYDLGGQPIQVQGGVALTQSGRLAGSTLTLDAALRNVMQFTGLSFPEALRMATRSPAEAMGWEGKKGVLRPGTDADVTLFDGEFAVRMTIVGGRVVFSARGV
jgi:N-acetylglucosamine-6-phosphate deacetylase